MNKPIKAKELVEILQQADPDALIIYDYEKGLDPLYIFGARIEHPMEIILTLEEDA